MNEDPLQLIIVSDLDGSLLDHHNYSVEPARDTLNQLAEAGIPVVFCTSKTRAEVLALRQQLANSAPYIVENGAAVYLPKSIFPEPIEGATDQGDVWCKAFCQPREHWLALVEQAKQRFGGCFNHFAAMSVESIADLTGLTLEQATKAKAREFGEPLHWLGSDEELVAFTQWCLERGASVLCGGRFVHVAGNADKGQAMSWLVGQYAQLTGASNTMSLALGDSHNDCAMLECADRAVVIRSPSHPPPPLSRIDGYIVSQAQGPAGWAEGVGYWLERLHLTLSSD